jgi:flavin-dependent dehydrogenase
MCAARALVPFARRVTIVERDELDGEPGPRRGVPQARHVHALLVRGRRTLDALFPGFDARMVELGALDVDFGTTFAALRPNGWATRAPTGVTSLWGSRDLVEAVIRERLAELSPVARIAATAEGLIADGARIVGVRLRGDDGGPHELRGELVVDATGRGSAIDRWLRALGAPAPIAEEVDPLAAYASRVYRIDRARWPAEWWWRGLWIDGALPDTPRAGVAFPVEHDKMIVTCVGLGGVAPPGDEAGFRAYLGGLRSPLLGELVDRLVPVGPIHKSRSTQNRFRRLERVALWPGLVVLGDAACAFNPVYGQGMTAAAITGELLGAALRRGRGDDLAARFHRAQAEALEPLWQLATQADFMWASTRGERSPGLRWVQALSVAIFETATFDPWLNARITPVFQLIEPTERLFAPAVLGRTLAATAARWRHRRRKPATNPPI